MRSLIIGSRGLVGSALKRQIPGALEGIPVEARQPNERYTDITKYESLFKVFSKERPDVVYLPAAIAHVDRCEESQGTDVHGCWQDGEPVLIRGKKDFILPFDRNSIQRKCMVGVIV